MSAALLMVEGLSYGVSSYGETGHGKTGTTTIVHDLSFQVMRGERLVVLGPSGCGKTTLLRLISGLLTPTSGRVRIDGEPPRPGIDTAVVFQSPRLLPWRRVAENVEVVLERKPKAERRATTARLLGQVGLEGWGAHWPQELSGGMRQRLALARALAMDVPLLLMDEPFANLDPLAREDMQKVVTDVTTAQDASGPQATICVTHSVEEALVLGDRIILMQAHPGRIMQVLQPKFSTRGVARRDEPGFYPQVADLRQRLLLAAAG